MNIISRYALQVFGLQILILSADLCICPDDINSYADGGAFMDAPLQVKLKGSIDC